MVTAMMDKLGVYTMLPRMSLADKQEIQDVLAAYIHFFDAGDIERFSRLMTENARFFIQAEDKRPVYATGRPEILKFFTMIRDSITTNDAQPRHHCTSILITEASDSAATATVGMIYTEYNFVQKQALLKSVGLYEVKFEKTAGRWLIDDWTMNYDA